MAPRSSAAYGGALFHGRADLAQGGSLSCSGCHGSYEKSADFGRVGGWGVRFADDGQVRDVGTDTDYNRIVRALKPLADRGNQMQQYFDALGKPHLAPQVSFPDRTGYIPPVLVGLWASAPYFHNGSVPTLRGVLDSRARPAIWERTATDPFAYHDEEVGLAYQVVSPGDLETRRRLAAAQDPMSATALRFRAIYDTTHGRGRSNTGHTYGDVMNDEERGCVIEFLKALSGPDMPALGG
jgi:hypothetical protein